MKTRPHFCLLDIQGIKFYISDEPSTLIGRNETWQIGIEYSEVLVSVDQYENITAKKVFDNNTLIVSHVAELRTKAAAVTAAATVTLEMSTQTAAEES